MATATTEMKPTNGERPDNVPALSGPRLPYHPAMKERFGIDKAEWKALCEAIFPNAVSTESIVLALSYCRARKLDPFKRNVHIVPIYNKDLRCMIDTIWPGIGELRTTAFRTGEYAGRGETQFGPDITRKVGSVEMTFPEWAQVTVYRMVKNQRVEFCGARVYWLETYATIKRGDDTPNDMWQNRPRGQIDKCAEAASLRGAFPEEIGGDYIPEEVQHRNGVVDSKPTKSLEDLSARLEAPYDPTATAHKGEAEGQGEELSEESTESLTTIDPDMLAKFDGLTTPEAIEAAFQHHMIHVSNLNALVAARDAVLAKLPKVEEPKGKGKKQGSLV